MCEDAKQNPKIFNLLTRTLNIKATITCNNHMNFEFFLFPIILCQTMMLRIKKSHAHYFDIYTNNDTVQEICYITVHLYKFNYKNIIFLSVTVVTANEDVMGFLQIHLFTVFLQIETTTLRFIIIFLFLVKQFNFYVFRISTIVYQALLMNVFFLLFVTHRQKMSPSTCTIFVAATFWPCKTYI